MKFDLSKFKKIKMDEHSTTLRHPAGHTIEIANKKLHPRMKEELAGLPLHEGPKKQANPKIQESKKIPAAKAPQMMADGGVAKRPLDIEAIPEEAKPAAQDIAGEIDMAAKPEAPIQDVILPEKAPEAPQQMPQDAPMPQAQDQVDPDLQRTKELYNHLRANLSPSSPGADPRAMLGPQNTFGLQGEGPTNFDRNIWESAVQHLQAEKAGKQKNEQVAIQNAMADNKARAAAGLPPIKIPASSQGQEPTMPPKPMAAPSQAPTQAPQIGSQDPYGAQASYDVYTKGIEEKRGGINAEAQALSAQGDMQARVAGEAARKEQLVQEQYNTHFQQLDDERKAFQHDIQNQHIDPQHYFSNMNTGQKLATAVGLILGGMGSGMTGQPNQAMAFMNSEIDRDIAAQKANLGKTENLLSANMRQFGNLRDATDMTRIMQRDIVANQLQQAAAKAMSPMAKARALQAAGDLDMGTAQMQGQMVMRKTLLGAVNGGQMAPERFIEMVLPDNAKAEARKELKEAQTMVSSRNNILGAFDKIAGLQSISSRIMNPIESKRQIDAILGAFLPGLSKETAGRFTEQDAAMLERTLRSPIGASAETQAIARSSLDKLIREKMHFPLLKGWGIDPTQAAGGSSRFDESGQKKIKLAPAVR